MVAGKRALCDRAILRPDGIKNLCHAPPPTYSLR
jgi:hypothetical protein